jgi:integrating conjugative element relaxase (TIGR03760 family)
MLGTESYQTILGVALIGGAISALIMLRRSTAALPDTADGVASASAPNRPSTAPTRWPEATLPVIDYTELVSQTGSATHIEQTRQSCGLNESTWSEYILPAIRQVGELMQQLPASESHHHAQPGGLWIHTCETLHYAVRLRQGTVLPAGRDAEDQSKHRHRWTAGIIIAALLHDVGKTITDLSVRLYGHTHRGTTWNALAGDMRTAQATDYAVDFPKTADRDYRAHQRHGALLMQRLVPAATLTWLSEDPPLLVALMHYLTGEADDTANPNPIATLVRAAERESVRANLLEGARTRFSTARAVPLIERLMEALRRMLAEGGHLPLNRPGAAGYVFHGDIWFAAARLANGVRDYLRTHESTAGIPGEDKNDRLFDVWQDYGACRTNPATGRALWGGRVEFDGSSAGYDLPSILRFPLDRLYPAPNQYPSDLAGHIAPLEQTSKLIDDPQPAPATIPAPPVAEPPFAVVVPVPASKTPDPAINNADVPPVPPLKSTATPPPLTAPLTTNNCASQPTATPTSLDVEDMATRADFLVPTKTATTTSLRPVAPAITLPALSGKSGAKADAGPSAEAIEFMTWVQRGIADASLTYNMPDALVHFVRHKDKDNKDECAMLLVSPLIFRRFAEMKGDGAEAGLTVQRTFTAAGWHLRGTGGKNVVSYQIMRKGDRGGNLLNGFLVLQPERFFNPVPQINDRLVFWNTDPTLAKSR